MAQPLVALGASTRGPEAICEVLAGLDGERFAFPIVVTQHMPFDMAEQLAAQFRRACSFEVLEARDGLTLRAGLVLVAPSSAHLRVRRLAHAYSVELDPSSPIRGCRPSTDAMLSSLAAAAGKGSLGVILTGLGEDGVLGSRAIRDAGGQVLAQDEASSAVWGMPGAVVRAGHATAVVALDKLASEISERCATMLDDPSGV